MQFSLGDVMFERTTLKASSFGTRFDIIIWYVESRYETWMYVESIEMSATDALSLPLPQWRGRCVSACLCLCVCVCVVSRMLWLDSRPFLFGDARQVRLRPLNTSFSRLLYFPVNWIFYSVACSGWIQIFGSFYVSAFLLLRHKNQIYEIQNNLIRLFAIILNFFMKFSFI